MVLQRTVQAPLHFVLAFVTQQAVLDILSARLAAAAVGDAVLWFAYPKQTSKRYRCDFHRDTGWQVLRAAGFDSVRMVAIDEDWSALRFRRTAFIKAAPRAAGFSGRPAGAPATSTRRG